MEEHREGFGHASPRPCLLLVCLLLVDPRIGMMSPNQILGIFPSTQPLYPHGFYTRNIAHLILNMTFPHSWKVLSNLDEEYGKKGLCQIGMTSSERTILLLSLIVPHSSFSHPFASPQAICLCSHSSFPLLNACW